MAAGKEVPCPKCGADLVSDFGSTPWCEQCEWGLDVYEPPLGASWLGRRLGALDHRIAYRTTMRYFRAVRGTAVTRPGWTGSKIMIVVMSLVSYALIIALVVAGVWLVLFDFPSLHDHPGLAVVGHRRRSGTTVRPAGCRR